MKSVGEVMAIGPGLSRNPARKPCAVWKWASEVWNPKSGLAASDAKTDLNSRTDCAGADRIYLVRSDDAPSRVAHEARRNLRADQDRPLVPVQIEDLNQGRERIKDPESGECRPRSDVRLKRKGFAEHSSGRSAQRQ